MITLLKFLHQSEIIKSFAEGRRLMGNGALEMDGQKIESDQEISGGRHNFQIGDQKVRVHITTDKELQDTDWPRL